MSTLREIFARHDTDKDTAHSYGPVYEQLLEPIRDTARVVLEIGVAGGGSLRAWGEYFPHAAIVGLEIDAAAGYNDDRVSTVIGDATDPDVLAQVAALGPFDLIVDDGSHDPADQAFTLTHLWPDVRSGGLYVIEDIQGRRYPPALALLAPGADPFVYAGNRRPDDRLLILRNPA